MLRKFYPSEVVQKLHLRNLLVCTRWHGITAKKNLAKNLRALIRYKTFQTMKFRPRHSAEFAR